MHWYNHLELYVATQLDPNVYVGEVWLLCKLSAARASIWDSQFIKKKNWFWLVYTNLCTCGVCVCVFMCPSENCLHIDILFLSKVLGHGCAYCSQVGGDVAHRGCGMRKELAESNFSADGKSRGWRREEGTGVSQLGAMSSHQASSLNIFKTPVAPNWGPNLIYMGLWRTLKILYIMLSKTF